MDFTVYWNLSEIRGDFNLKHNPPPYICIDAQIKVERGGAGLGPILRLL